MNTIRATVLLALAAFSCALLSGCNQPAESAPTAVAYSTDVPGIDESMLSATFWINQLDADAIRLSADQIDARNRRNLQQDAFLHDLDAFPDTLPAADVQELMESVSRVPGAPRFFADGQMVRDADYQRLNRLIALEALPESVSVRWGLVTARAAMRSFPTMEKVFKSPTDLDLDRLQETGVFPGQRVALLHQSRDGEWWFAVNYHYAAWVPKAAVAVGQREEIADWLGRTPRLVVSGAQVRTNYNPIDTRTSEQVLDMGVSLPLLTADDVGHNVHGQNPFASHIVALPVRGETGQLEVVPTLIARSRDVAVGHLDYRPSQILKQAFKFLGERYGWGHDYNGRDCTGFVGEVYKSFGLLMPRNSGQQGRSGFTKTRFVDDAQSRAEALAELSVGDLIYIPGHVMMYIGRVGNEPYVIHDVTGLAYFDDDQTFYRGTLSGVSVTPLSPLRLGPEKSYVDSIYAIKTIQ